MILWFSLLACLLASLYLPHLGQHVLRQRIIFIDLALAQVAAVGYAIGIAMDISGLLVAACITVVAIFAIAALPEKMDLPKEGIMGALYASAASAGMMILASMPHAEGQMMALLFGSMLGVDEKELFILASSGVVALLLMRFHHMKHYFGRVLFYSSLAFAVVPAIYSLGVVLVFSLLVIPGLAVWRGGQTGQTWIAIVLASLASLSGVMLSNDFDFPPSSSVVVCLCVFALVLRLAVSFQKSLQTKA